MNDDVAQYDSAQFAHRSFFLWTPPAETQSHKDGRVANVSHCNVAYCDILEQRTINGLKRKSSGIIKHAVRHSYILKTAIGFSTKLNSTSWTESTIRVSEIAFVRPVQQGSLVISTHLAVTNRYVLSRSSVTQCIRTLRTNCIIERRVDTAI